MCLYLQVFLDEHSFYFLLPHLYESTFGRNINKKLRISNYFSIYTYRVTYESISHVTRCRTESYLFQEITEQNLPIPLYQGGANNIHSFYVRSILRMVRLAMIEHDDTLCELLFQDIRMLVSLESLPILCDFFECCGSTELEVRDDEIILDRYELLIHTLWRLIDRD